MKDKQGKGGGVKSVAEGNLPKCPAALGRMGLTTDWYRHPVWEGEVSQSDFDRLASQ